MITIAIDPGLVTGVSYISADDWAVPMVEEITGRLNFYDWIMERFASYSRVDVEVVCETFSITNRTGKLSPQYDALYIEGAIELLCHSDNRKLYKQPRSMKAFGTNDKLKALGWWFPSTGGHANDANRHLLRHLVAGGDKSLIKRLETIL